VAPVRMMCMVEFGFQSVNGFEKICYSPDKETLAILAIYMIFLFKAGWELISQAKYAIGGA
jgi:hypothetical protein